MASLTFGSVGDIIAICDVLRTVVQALSESRGSVSEYQALIRELQVLSQAITSVRELLRKYPHLKGNDRLQEILKACKNSLVRELEHILPYRSALQSNPTSSAVKSICRKIRWLANKDDRTMFRAAIASHILSLSTVLATCSIDTQHELHRATIEQLKQGFEEIKLTEEPSNRITEAENTSLEDALQETKTALTTRQDRADQQALVRYDEISRKLDALHMAVSERNQFPIVRINSSIVQNRVSIMLIIKLLVELTSTGLAGAYHFLRLIQLAISNQVLQFSLQSNCLIVEDAILRSIYIDTDLVSYETFTQIIRDSFKNTPGARIIAAGQYSFEDTKQRPLCLEGVWSSEILKNRTVFMRASTTAMLPGGSTCSTCDTAIREELARFGRIYKRDYSRLISKTKSCFVCDVFRAFPDVHRQAVSTIYASNEETSFFKRFSRNIMVRYIDLRSDIGTVRVNRNIRLFYPGDLVYSDSETFRFPSCDQ